MAHVALLGGSFAPLGGQNLIEAAACGCPLVMGPHTFNFAQAAEQAVAAGAAERVADAPAAVQRALQLVQAAGTAGVAHMSQQALDFAQQHTGAAQRTAQVFVKLLR
jgi:3-deoxy-D-manno-octulosonic-acid transferase